MNTTTIHTFTYTTIVFFIRTMNYVIYIYLYIYISFPMFPDSAGGHLTEMAWFRQSGR